MVYCGGIMGRHQKVNRLGGGVKGSCVGKSEKVAVVTLVRDD